jgi:hypothetical protein
MNETVEFRQRVCIFSTGTTHDQAVAQVMQNSFGLGEHKRSDPVDKRSDPVNNLPYWVLGGYARALAGQPPLQAKLSCG